MLNKIPFMVILILMFCASKIFAQTKTEETKRTVDSTTGVVTVTKSEIISKSEDITPINNMFIINPLKFFLFYNISYYGKISDVSVIGFGIQTPTISDVGGIGVNAEIRLHPSSKAPRGFYFAPNVSFNQVTAYNPDYDSKVSVFSIGALVGWQWFPSDDFAIGLGIGIDQYFMSGSGSDVGIFSSYNGTSPAIRFDIGYAW
ncbi:hypothetical protein MASR1M45_27020 [Candidatus Kapaibacterium sp.]